MRLSWVQIRFHIPGTPVPVTAQTFAVLLSGAVLGSRAGAGSQLLYWFMGAAGLPVFAQAAGGWGAATGATFGYLAGFIAAAWLVGRLSEHGGDRTVRSALPLFILGNLTIYALGLPWLILSLPSINTFSAAVAIGFAPFVIIDTIKVLLAGVALPWMWRHIGTIS